MFSYIAWIQQQLNSGQLAETNSFYGILLCD